MLIGIDGQSYLLLSNPNPRMVLLVGGLRKHTKVPRRRVFNCPKGAEPTSLQDHLASLIRDLNSRTYTIRKDNPAPEIPTNESQPVNDKRSPALHCNEE
jgi:hypothetical protein